MKDFLTDEPGGACEDEFHSGFFEDAKAILREGGLNTRYSPLPSVFDELSIGP